MASVQKTMVFFLVMAALEASLAAVYKVGDSTGWTTLGNYNYTNWATTKNFLVGDTILFEYNKQFHNVMQVKHTAFRACNTSSPIATYSSGNDSITIRRTGHMYFLCGVPGHCQSGQKVDVRVPSLSAMAPTPSGSQAPSGSASSPPASQAPSGSGASPFGSQSPFGSATSPSGSQSPSGSATSPSPSGAMAPGPSQNSAPHPSNGLLGKAGLAVLAFAVSISGFAY